MATTSSAFASLQAPPHEDTMDMSSPARRHDDDDIDIDIDFTYNEDTLVVDDQMLDDEQARPQTATDTAMDYDAEHDTTLVQEADMMDDPSHEVSNEAIMDAQIEEDDELIDYGEEDYLVDDRLHDAALQESLIDPIAANRHQGDNTGEVVDYAGPHSTSGLDTEAQTAERAVDQPQDVAEESSLQTRDEQASNVQDLPLDEQDVLDGEHDSLQVSDPQQGEVVQNASQLEDESGHANETAVSEPTSAVFIETSVRRASDVPASPTDTGLHHMILQFGDSDIPLFQSRQSPEGLLTNDNLVGHHLADLISNCKERLQETENAVFPDHEECMLQFQGLPLILRESSKAAYSCTLNDVLDVYLLLHHNAGTNHVPPLFLTLSIPESFTDVLASLKEAAESGQGIPNVQYSEEDIEEDQQSEESGEEHIAEGELQDNYQEQYPEVVHESSHVGQGEDPYTEGDNDNYTDEHEAQEPDATTQLDEDPSVHREALDDVVEGEDISHVNLGTPSPGAAQNSVSSVVTEEKRNPPSADQSGPVAAASGSIEEYKASSPGSSATAQNDDEDNFAGEYESDLEFINWDEDEPLMCDLSDETNDISITRTTDLTTDEQLGDIEERDTGDATGVKATVPEDPDTAYDVPQDDIEEEFEDEVQAAEANEDQFGADDEAGDCGEDHESAVDQTDLYDEQHNEYQSGLEDEQYHTARDFLNGQTDQHGPANGLDALNSINGDHLQTKPSPLAAAGNYDDPNEVIDFDDDTPAEHEARKGSPAVVGAVTSDSPLGKRSFDEHADEDLYDDDEPELKKARSR